MLFAIAILLVALNASISAATMCSDSDSTQKLVGADIVIIVDDSISMKDKVKTAASGMQKLATDLNVNSVSARFSIVRYGGNPVIHLPFVSDSSLLFEAMNNLSSNSLGYEAAFEAVRRSLPPVAGRDIGSTDFCDKVFQDTSAPCTLNWRANSLRVVVQLTDEDSDLPRSTTYRTPGQISEGKVEDADAGYPLKEPWKVEIDVTAKAITDQKALYIGLYSQKVEDPEHDVNTIAISKEQFGDFKLASQDENFNNFDAAKTLQALEQNGLGRSLQAQILKQGGSARLFDINAFAKDGKAGAILLQIFQEIQRVMNVSSQFCSDGSCPTGTYLSSGTCAQCPENTMTAGPGAKSVAECVSKPGFFAKSGTKAAACPVDSFCTQGVETASKCPTGSSSNGKTGLKSAEECVCALNFYGTKGSCTACPVNSKTLQMNTQAKEGCVCDVGFYGANGGECTRCPGRKTTKQAGSTTVDQCVCETDDLKGPDCLPAPKCQNNGTANANNTACVCPTAFKGTLCELPACLNNGTMDATNTTCICPSGFTGPTCATQVRMCQNGATVKPDGSGCVCPAGFTGDTCGTRIVTCMNGGVAKPDGSGCICASGFTGDSCNTTTLVCLNGGVLQSNGTFCTCPTGFSGVDCAQKLATKTCMNGGTAAVDGSCVCIGGYSGLSCEVAPPTPVSPAAMPSPTPVRVTCLNGGSASPDGTTCICINGYSGISCERAPTTNPNPLAAGTIRTGDSTQQPVSDFTTQSLGSFVVASFGPLLFALFFVSI